jgi:hypothetical protein
MLAQTYTTDGGSGAAGVVIIVYLAVLVFVIASLWKVFTKAGEEGWKAIIPIYNFIVLLKIVGRPWWWILLLLIPFVNFVILIIVYNDLSKSFGKGVGFTIGLIFLGIIFLPILGFGPATYQGPMGGSAGAVPPPPPPMPA